MGDPYMHHQDGFHQIIEEFWHWRETLPNGQDGMQTGGSECFVDTERL